MRIALIVDDAGAPSGVAVENAARVAIRGVRIAAAPHERAGPHA